ncbi:hypothetical protein J6590_026899, partial [Homalodisca vitripennis]
YIREEETQNSNRWESYQRDHKYRSHSCAAGITSFEGVIYGVTSVLGPTTAASTPRPMDSLITFSDRTTLPNRFHLFLFSNSLSGSVGTNMLIL